MDGTIVENNTAYGGSRAETAMHYQVAKDHGFNDIADVVILDEYGSYLVLSHFKGHAMAGFGGAIKNISIDCDCDGNPHEPDIHDIGILASADPVALDQACIDLVNNVQGNRSLLERIERQNDIHTLERAEEISLGSRSYALVDIGG